jgi:1-acyl-sn-glycerol-3-phosphate acyltransferase
MTQLGRALLRGLQRLTLYLLLLQLGLTSLAWNLLALPMYYLLPRELGQRVGRAGIAANYSLFWTLAKASGMLRVDASELDALDQESGGLIIAANHPSMMDALLIVARLRNGVCVMKAELMRNVFLGSGARLARYIRNDSPRGMIRCAVAHLRAGSRLVLFPEGTRTVHPPVNDFRPGMSLIAHLAQVPIQTVLIETDSPYLGKGWPIWRAPVPPVRVRLRLGRRFAPQARHADLLAEIQRYFERELKT